MKRSITAAFFVLSLQGVLAGDLGELFPLFEKRQNNLCETGEKVCGSGCIPNSSSCCPDGSGGCPTGSFCDLGSNGEYGCCPDGETCSGAGGVITTGGAIPSITFSTSSPPASAAAGATITSGNEIGVIGTDGTTRFCTTGSYLCPASLDYGCCANNRACGLTNCPALGAMTTSLSSNSLSSAAVSGVTSIPANVPFTTGSQVGVVGTDGTTRYCTTGSYLCPASLDYGCCPNTRGCGLTNCPLTGQDVSEPTNTGSNLDTNVPQETNNPLTTSQPAIINTSENPISQTPSQARSTVSGVSQSTTSSSGSSGTGGSGTNPITGKNDSPSLASSVGVIFTAVALGLAGMALFL